MNSRRKNSLLGIGPRGNCAKRLFFEKLEDKILLAVMWANETDINNAFNIYGPDEGVARSLVNRAIMDWNAVILDQDFDNDNNPATNNFLLNVVALNLASGARGATNITQLTTGGAGQAGWTVGVPMAATIQLDNDGGGTGWFFDQTPYDDAEFTAIVNSGSSGTGAAFHASFVDFAANNLNYNDFYRTIVHEIGHALGISYASGQSRLINFLTYAGTDQINPTQVIGGQTFATDLWRFHNPAGQFGVTATLTEFGGAHTYEGPADPSFPTAPTHPNDLLNAGRTVPPPGANPIATTRQFISDLDVQILADAYGYSVVLPSTLNTAHVTLDSFTGTLLVQGGVTAAGVSQSDAIVIDTISSDIRVRLYNSSGVLYATERVPTAHVTQIVVSRAGDNIANPGSLVVSSGLQPLVKEVYMVRSSNQDAIATDKLDDGFARPDNHDTACPYRLRIAA